MHSVSEASRRFCVESISAIKSFLFFTLNYSLGIRAKLNSIGWFVVFPSVVASDISRI